MTPATDEKHLQQNAIDLLTRMGYTYISPNRQRAFTQTKDKIA